MMKKTFLLIVCLMSISSTARAQGFVSPFLGFNFGGDSANCVAISNCEDRRLNFGLSFGKRNGVMGLEEDIAYAPDFFGKTGEANGVLTVMTDLLIVIPAGPIQPYGLIGIGLVRPHATFNSFGFNQNAVGYDIGGGLNIFLTKSFGIRGDVRHVKTLQDITLGLFSNQKLDFWRASAGLTFAF
jgi:opacity protein-like surface antigen